MLPPAPGRFSITTGWPHAVVSHWPMMRASVSLPPPAAYGEISRMGLDSNSGTMQYPYRRRRPEGLTIVIPRTRKLADADSPSVSCARAARNGPPVFYFPTTVTSSWFSSAATSTLSRMEVCVSL